MPKLLSQNKIVIAILVGLFLFFFSLSYFAEATYDAGDGIRHYLVSRYCWQHHDLFLYSWGKPFFTLITSPFSQFGLLGINIFNIICGIGSAFLTYKIAQKLKLNYAILAIPFLLFTPCYFPTLNSGLTEPLFGFILIAAIYLMFDERFLLACLLVSFLPFVRTEGNLILPLFFIVLLYRKKYFLSPLLAFGTFVYSVVGYFYFGDFFWVKNQNPYNGENKAFYGSGELTHFVANHNFIWGSALGLLFVIGIAAIALSGFKTIKNKELKESKLPEELILIYGSFAIYFIAHSIMWWKGLANSLGLLRVLAAVIPCSALICLRGFNLVMIPFFKEKKILEIIIVTSIVIWVIRSPFKHEYFPYKLDQEQTVVKEAGDWFKQSPFTNQKVYYLYPLLAHVLNVDSFDPNKVGELWGLYPTINTWGIGAIPDSTIIFWDAHFGPNECKIPLDTIMNDPRFDLIKSFKPKTEFTTLGGYKFEIYVFLKLKKPIKLDTLARDFFDLESNSPDLSNLESIESKTAFSGKNACKLSAKTEYSVTATKRISVIPKNTSSFKLTCKISDPLNNSKEAFAVMSVDDENGKNLYWSGIPLGVKNDSTSWKSVSTDFAVKPNSFPNNAIIKFYIWNKTKKEFYLDDLEIDYLGIRR
ncbi:MAG: hypothetical protein NTX97_02425 [Bacteroidetes bacterium]|nr:hypothetical protein [Bacteroidota bacterium]